MRTVYSIAASGLILLVTFFANLAAAQTVTAGKQLPDALTAAILGDSRPRSQRIVPPVRPQPFAPATGRLRRPISQQKKTSTVEKQESRIVGVTTLAQPTQPAQQQRTTGQRPSFRPLQLGSGQPTSRVGVSRFANSGMRPSESGGLPVTPRVVPEYTQDQRAALLERSIRERAESESRESSETSASLSYEAKFYRDELAADNPSGQPGGGNRQRSSDSPTAQNSAPSSPAISTALPVGFGANRLARPTTGVSRFAGPAVRGPASPRRASGIPSSPMILPAGAGRRSSAGRLRGGCGGG